MKIQELLSSPEKWTKGLNAKDKQNNCVSPWSENAVCWCIYGAILKCYSESLKTTEEMVEKATYASGWQVLSAWNDAPERTFEEVKALIEKLDI